MIDHLAALLVDDGREFAMVRKGDLESLLLNAAKHGEERRRYMANNKALMARADLLEGQVDSLARFYSQLTNEHCSLLSRVSAAIRKAPATCRMLGLIK